MYTNKLSLHLIQQIILMSDVNDKEGFSKLLKDYNEDYLLLFYRKLQNIAVEEYRKDFLIKFLKQSVSSDKKEKLDIRVLEDLMDAYILDLSKKEQPEIKRDNQCQCFTCRNKDNIDALIAYYTGCYDTLKEVIELTEECQYGNKLNKDLAFKSLLAKLNYERDCNGVLLEEVELKKKG